MTLDDLPVELCLHIMTFIDESPLSLLSMTMVSKRWKALLTTGKQAEAEWKRRCRQLGAVRRATGCKTWRSTYLSKLRRHCLGCARPTTILYGRIWPDGPRWSRVCSVCHLDHPFLRMVTQRELMDRYNFTQDDFKGLPYKLASRKHYNIKEYMFHHALQVKSEKKRVSMEKAIAGYTGDRLVLRTIVEPLCKLSDQEDQAGATLQTSSPRLKKLVEEFLSCREDERQIRGNSLIDFYFSLQATQAKVAAALQAARITLNERDVQLHTKLTKPNEKYTWIDVLSHNARAASPDTFLEAVNFHRKASEQDQIGQEAHHRAGKLRRKLRETEKASVHAAFG